MSAAPPSPHRAPGYGSDKLVDLDQHRLHLLERSLAKTRSELAHMEARWFHAMAEMHRLQRRLEVGAAELAALRERLSRTGAEGYGRPGDRARAGPPGRAWRWWERWP